MFQTFNMGIGFVIITNKTEINKWRNAPLWTKKNINVATKNWYKNLK